MTLKKYNVIVYFIILLNLVVIGIIAQDAEPSTETSIPSGEKAGKNSTAESCLKETACINTNETIRLCNGRFRTPNTYVEEGIRSGTYEPEDRGLAKCMCNQQYYDDLSKCLECFNSAEGTEFKVPLLEEYQNKCKKVGTTFTETRPQVIPSIIPSKVKWGVIGGVAVLVLILVGIAVFKFYKKKKVSAEGSGTKKPSSSYQFTPQTSEYYPPPPSGQSSQYPPPQQSGHYPPPQSGQYPPPQQSGHYPPPQGGEYPPPPQEYPPPQSSQYPPPSGGQGDRVGQSGQSDSYYGGNF